MLRRAYGQGIVEYSAALAFASVIIAVAFTGTFTSFDDLFSQIQDQAFETMTASLEEDNF